MHRLLMAAVAAGVVCTVVPAYAEKILSPDEQAELIEQAKANLDLATLMANALKEDAGAQKNDACTLTGTVGSWSLAAEGWKLAHELLEKLQALRVTQQVAKVSEAPVVTEAPPQTPQPSTTSSSEISRSVEEPPVGIVGPVPLPQPRPRHKHPRSIKFASKPTALAPVSSPY